MRGNERTFAVASGHCPQWFITISATDLIQLAPLLPFFRLVVKVILENYPPIAPLLSGQRAVDCRMILYGITFISRFSLSTWLERVSRRDALFYFNEILKLSDDISHSDQFSGSIIFSISASSRCNATACLSLSITIIMSPGRNPLRGSIALLRYEFAIFKCCECCDKARRSYFYYVYQMIRNITRRFVQRPRVCVTSSIMFVECLRRHCEIRFEPSLGFSRATAFIVSISWDAHT